MKAEKLNKLNQLKEFIQTAGAAFLMIALALSMFGLGLFVLWGLFAVPVWIICWAFGYTFIWTYPIGAFVIYIMLASIARTANIDDDED